VDNHVDILGKRHRSVGVGQIADNGFFMSTNVPHFVFVGDAEMFAMTGAAVWDCIANSEPY